MESAIEQANRMIRERDKENKDAVKETFLDSIYNCCIDVSYTLTIQEIIDLLEEAKPIVKSGLSELPLSLK